MQVLRRSCVAIVAICCLVLLTSFGYSPKYQIGSCGNIAAHVKYLHDVDYEHACEALRRSVTYLVDGYGLKMPASVAVTFKERVELADGRLRQRVLGSYDRTKREIEVTSMAAGWLREPGRLLFGQPIDDELHVGLVVHEIVHALTKDNYRIAVPGCASEEYLAYAVQLATTEQATRERLLQNYQHLDHTPLHKFTEILHQVRPHEFGVRAYQHFAIEGHAYMVEEILSGRFLTFIPDS